MKNIKDISKEISKSTFDDIEKQDDTFYIKPLNTTFWPFAINYSIKNILGNKVGFREVDSLHRYPGSPMTGNFELIDIYKHIKDVSARRSSTFKGISTDIYKEELEDITRKKNKMDMEILSSLHQIIDDVNKASSNYSFKLGDY